MTLKENGGEKEQLLNEILKLKRQLLWYKRSYDERSLAGIVYDRLKARKIAISFSKHISRILRSHQKVKIHISPNSSKLPQRVLCSIVNHNESENAIKLYKLLTNYFDTVILDSGSTRPPKNALKLPNLYYSGLLNKSWAIAKKNNYSFLLLICSDVFMEQQNASDLFSRLLKLDYKRTGLYSPSSKGGSHPFCEKQSGSDLRTVPFVEGFMFLCDMQILDCICPINTKDNLYGWGLDIAKGFYANENNKLCFIDDQIEVVHKTGTGYSRETAEYEMLMWVNDQGNEKLKDFFRSNLAG